MTDTVIRRQTRPIPLEVLERYRPLLDDWNGFVETMATPLPACVWTNPLRATPGQLEGLLDADGLAPRPIGWDTSGFRLDAARRFGSRWWYLAGLCHGQEEVSRIPVALLDPQPGERILDLCAAPGGKTAQIGIALGNCGTVVANDLTIDRMRPLRANLERLGLINVSTTTYDGAAYPNAAGYFDRVLVDAPCSGEGTLRKPTTRRTPSGPEISRRFAERQMALLRRAFTLCRPGGRIVYSTCTFAPEENERVVDQLLGELDGRLRVVHRNVPGLATSPGITEWEGRRLHPSLAHTLRIWPHLNDTGGFYVATLQKGGAEEATEPASPTVTPLSAPELERAVIERFGIDRGELGDRVICRRTGRGLYVTASDHRPPIAPEPEVIGMRFIRTTARPPKLSTAAAMLLAPSATRNVVDLDADAVEPYLRRASLTLEPIRSMGCTGTGYVLIRHQGFGLGMGYLTVETHLLESLFPKRWLGVSL